MRNFVLPLLLVASLGASSVAMAAGTVTQGVVKTLNAKTCTVTLADKTVYHFAPKCDFSKIKLNEKVAITSTLKGKIHNATAIVAVM